MNKTEQQRLLAVKRFRHMNFDLDENLQNLLRLATEIYETPVAFLSLIDEENQWFKAARGFEVDCMPRRTSFCTHVIETPSVLIVNDAARDLRFSGNPLVKQLPSVRFYAGAPLTTADGYHVGTLCVMDSQPREVPASKQQLIAILSQQAINLMELALTYQVLNEKMEQLALQNKVLSDISFIQSHEFRGPLTSIMGLMDLMKMEGYVSSNQYLQLMEQAVKKLDEKVHIVVKSTEVAQRAYAA